MKSTKDKSSVTFPTVKKTNEFLKTLDAFKLLQFIVNFSIFLVVLFILIFIGLFGHIISNDIEKLHVSLLGGFIKNRIALNKVINPKLIHEDFKISPEGYLIVKGKLIKTQEELDEILE